jgi:uncharacterized membrane protein
MWAAVGTATLYVGARRRLSALESCGLVMIGLSIWDLLARRLPMHAEPYTPFLNGRFLAYAAPCAALLLCAGILKRAGRQAQGAGVLLTLGVWAFTPLLANELWARHDLLPLSEHGAASRQAAEAVRACGLAAWVALLARASRRESPFSIVPMLVPLVGAFMAGLSLLVVAHRVDAVPLANPVFLSGLAVAAATCYAATRLRGSTAIVLLYAALAYGLVLLAAEFVAHAELSDVGAGTREDLRFRAQLWISMSWAAYAAALLGAGFLRRHVPLRWAGLGVFLIALAKVFIVDLAGLTQVYRIGSFLGLGLALVGASFLYQRTRAAT